MQGGNLDGVTFESVLSGTSGTSLSKRRDMMDVDMPYSSTSSSRMTGNGLDTGFGGLGGAEGTAESIVGAEDGVDVDARTEEEIRFQAEQLKRSMGGARGSTKGSGPNRVISLTYENEETSRLSEVSSQKESQGCRKTIRGISLEEREPANY